MSVTAIISAIAITAPTNTSAPKSSSKSTATKSEPGVAVGVDTQGRPVDAEGNIVEATELGKEKLKTETPLQKPKSATEETANTNKQTIKGLEIVGQIKTAEQTKAEQANKEWKDTNAKPVTEVNSGNPIKDKVTSLQNDIANLTNSSGQSRIKEATSDQKALIDTLKTNPEQYGFKAPEADASSQQSALNSGSSTGGPLGNALSGGAGGLGGSGAGAINSGNININSGNVNSNVSSGGGATGSFGGSGNVSGGGVIQNSNSNFQSIQQSSHDITAPGGSSLGGLTNTNSGILSRENVIGGEGARSTNNSNVSNHIESKPEPIPEFQEPRET